MLGNDLEVHLEEVDVQACGRAECVYVGIRRSCSTRCLESRWNVELEEVDLQAKWIGYGNIIVRDSHVENE